MFFILCDYMNIYIYIYIYIIYYVYIYILYMLFKLNILYIMYI